MIGKYNDIEDTHLWHCPKCDSTQFNIEVTIEGVLILCRSCGVPKGYITEFEPWDESL